VEYLPNLRLAWKASTDFLAWVSAARAVRAPSRLDRELYLPTTAPFLIAGGPDFVAEIANVYELGVRGQALRALTYSATVFWHEWDHLRSGAAPVAVLENKIEGSVYGLEAWAAWEAIQG